MNEARFNIEKTILERSFSNRFVFMEMDKAQEAYLDLGLRVCNGSTYRLKIKIPVDYPASVPQVFITYPCGLLDFYGKSLALEAPSHKMHTLQTVDGCIQLCHYKKENWHSNVTLYKVALKCLIWLEAYESHLRTGKGLDEYLGK